MRRKNLTDDVPQVVPVVRDEFLVGHGQQLAVQRRQAEGCWLRLFYVSHCHRIEEFPVVGAMRPRAGGVNTAGKTQPGAKFRWAEPRLIHSPRLSISPLLFQGSFLSSQHEVTHLRELCGYTAT